MSQNKVDETGTLQLAQFLELLWRRKWLLIFTSVILGAVALVFTKTAIPPTYRSTATVMLETREQQVTDFQSVMSGLSGDTSIVNTEVEILKSRSLLEQVVREMDLVSDPEFNAQLRVMKPHKRLLKTVIDWGKDRLGWPSAPQLIISEQAQVDASVKALMGQMSVRNIPLSLVFAITVETGSPKKSARIANHLAATYIQDQLDAKQSATEQASGWLGDQVSELKTKLQDIEAEAKRFDLSTKLLSVEALQLKNIKLKEMRDRIAKLERLHAQAPQNSALQSADFSGQADADFVNAKLGVATSVSRAQLVQLIASSVQLQAEIDIESNDLLKLQELQREVEASRAIYEYFLGRLKEISVQQGTQKPDSRLLSRAVVPLHTATPNVGLIVSIAMVFGGALGTGIALGGDQKTATIQHAKDAEEATGITVMGSIPLVKGKTRQAVLKQVVENPNLRPSESVRNLRTSILLSDRLNQPQVVMITSSLPGEGKTTQAILFAHSLAQAEKKVLLIDTDYRKNTLAEVFDAPQPTGLLDVLAQRAGLKDAIIQTSFVNVDVLTAGSAIDDDKEGLSLPRLANLLAELRGQYDYIVMDTAPVLAIPDARALSKFSDANIFIVKCAKTTVENLRQGLRAFSSIGAEVHGLSLTQQGGGYANEAAERDVQGYFKA
ncbi:protein-tyrosine kinase [Amylibacter marinus]|uniref:non-specific protein-tyrosine kinase n=1 Tax=Amylibacter marinus TaxID=1475483 RepID=A0ABQ5VRT6_9RHOB|nr:polysaccharide biosynthesis tyrosine autokinase [Amylibacter marinus]GLQ34001.1 protein-tyrosine kinase [Amylibacter marinus]